MNDIIARSLRTAKEISDSGLKNIAICFHSGPYLGAEDVQLFADAGVSAIVDFSSQAIDGHDIIPVYSPEAFALSAASVDALLNLDIISADGLYHLIGTNSAFRRWLVEHPAPIVQYDYGALVGHQIGVCTPEVAVVVSDLAAYTNANALSGHYCEFGVWLGRSMFWYFKLLSPFLRGNFVAFDSFGGLSRPLADELANSAGDFSQGRYFSNEATFRAHASLLGYTDERIRTVAGYFSDSLPDADHGIASRSVSVAHIDCDLYEPSAAALAYLSERLEDGALIGFDDYFLNRASPRSGERRAIREWLAANPSFELTPYARTAQFDQWFVFNRLG